MSTSSVLLSEMEKLIRLLEAPLESTRRLLAADSLSDDAELQIFKGTIVGTFKVMVLALAFLPLDFSRGRWNADDVKSLHERVREVATASIFLLNFHISRRSATAQMERLGTSVEHGRQGGQSTPSSRDTPETDDHQVQDQDHQSADKESRPPASSNGSGSTFGLVDAMKSPEHRAIRPGLLEALQAATLIRPNKLLTNPLVESILQSALLYCPLLSIRSCKHSLCSHGVTHIPMSIRSPFTCPHLLSSPFQFFFKIPTSAQTSLLHFLFHAISFPQICGSNMA
ncbi:hypothetical protein E4U58_004044 [Claviceps cyperi]|nr:hypothetical protein E4U58_004044 [Claviceps cyperi]